jgi:hypothetical protein
VSEFRGTPGGITHGRPSATVRDDFAHTLPNMLASASLPVRTPGTVRQRPTRTSPPLTMPANHSPLALHHCGPTAPPASTSRTASVATRCSPFAPRPHRASVRLGHTRTIRTPQRSKAHLVARPHHLAHWPPARKAVAPPPHLTRRTHCRRTESAWTTRCTHGTHAHPTPFPNSPCALAPHQAHWGHAGSVRSTTRPTTLPLRHPHQCAALGKRVHVDSLAPYLRFTCAHDAVPTHSHYDASGISSRCISDGPAMLQVWSCDVHVPTPRSTREPLGCATQAQHNWPAPTPLLNRYH